MFCNLSVIQLKKNTDNVCTPGSKGPAPGDAKVVVGVGDESLAGSAEVAVGRAAISLLLAAIGRMRRMMYAQAKLTLQNASSSHVDTSLRHHLSLKNPREMQIAELVSRSQAYCCIDAQRNGTADIPYYCIYYTRSINSSRALRKSFVRREKKTKYAQAMDTLHTVESSKTVLHTPARSQLGNLAFNVNIHLNLRSATHII